MSPSVHPGDDRLPTRAMAGTRDLALRAIASLAAALDAATPDSVSGSDATTMAELFAHAARLAEAGTALYARRAAATEAYRTVGHPDAGTWLARVSQTPLGRAKEALSTAQALVALPAVARAYRSGELSGPMAKVITTAGTCDPSSAQDLLDVARSGSFPEVVSRARQIVARSRSEEGKRAQEARAHARRFCRISTPEGGGVRIDTFLTSVLGARVVASLEREAAAVFAETRAAGKEYEPHERYRADAMVRLLCGRRSAPTSGGPDLGRSGPGTHVVVRVDADALRRGRTRGSEICEICGVGPVSVATARSLLGDALFNVVVTEGVDVRSVTGTRRTIPTPLRVALFERDRTCVVPGCAVSHHLEIDHWRTGYALNGPTNLGNLARLCGPHHSMKTNTGWRLVGGPGKWRWLPPRAGP
ncbi:MAG: HNH endonuclease signature motif containing protein [Acidimicrobiales bacterium]